MDATYELLVERDGDRVRLACPRPGFYTCAVPRGRVLSPGESVGALIVLGRAAQLVVPAGVHGRVVSERPEPVRAPVEHGTVLVELDTAALAEAGAGEDAETAAEAGGELVLRSPQTGRFYQRPSPTDEVFAKPGAELRPGTSVGLIEVMKTFAQVAYAAAGGLPESARFVRYLASDGSEVAEGDPIAEVEPG